MEASDKKPDKVERAFSSLNRGFDHVIELLVSDDVGTRTAALKTLIRLAKRDAEIGPDAWIFGTAIVRGRGHRHLQVISRRPSRASDENRKQEVGSRTGR